ncbi:MAG TPA: GNAT family N-acetyltransferase [Terriglobales bacterium]|nr:GNAT family N-acetyltransferase [Terriglobales bacterium]
MKRKQKVPDNISIDPATEADLPSIEPLLLELMEAVDDTEGFEIEKAFQNFRVLINDPAHHILLAKDEDGVVGFVNFSVRKTILHPGPSGLIDELVVSTSHRGKGIGKNLLQAAIEKCRKLGCCEVEVTTEKSNSRAREFYKKCGFKEDSVLLELNLG